MTLWHNLLIGGACDIVTWVVLVPLLGGASMWHNSWHRWCLWHCDIIIRWRLWHCDMGGACDIGDWRTVLVTLLGWCPVWVQMLLTIIILLSFFLHHCRNQSWKRCGNCQATRISAEVIRVVIVISLDCLCISWEDCILYHYIEHNNFFFLVELLWRTDCMFYSLEIHIVIMDMDSGYFAIRLNHNRK